jgi:hypothetical protein
MIRLKANASVQMLARPVLRNLISSLKIPGISLRITKSIDLSKVHTTSQILTLNKRRQSADFTILKILSVKCARKVSAVTISHLLIISKTI